MLNKRVKNWVDIWALESLSFKFFHLLQTKIFIMLIEILTLYDENYTLCGDMQLNRWPRPWYLFWEEMEVENECVTDQCYFWQDILYNSDNIMHGRRESQYCSYIPGGNIDNKQQRKVWIWIWWNSILEMKVMSG